MTQQQIRFLVLSDTHDHAFPVPASLPAVDVVIHCGDLTMIGGLSNYRRALDSLAACPAEIKLVIPGNHDVSLDAKWWDENMDSDDDEDEPVRARALFTLDEYTRCGVRFLDEGTHEIALHDGRSLKSMRRSIRRPLLAMPLGIAQRRTGSMGQGGGSQMIKVSIL
ncbi:Ser/Thr protein phosphatase family protein [Metarhizium brunneum]